MSIVFVNNNNISKYGTDFCHVYFGTLVQDLQCLFGRTGVGKLLRRVGVFLAKDQLRSSARPLLRAALSKFFSFNAGGAFCDMIVQHVPHPMAAAKVEIARFYTGPNNNNSESSSSSSIVKAMMACDPNGPLIIRSVKSYSTPDESHFWPLDGFVPER
jgi:hypothetical protein